MIPANVFFEKGFRLRKKNYKTFWLGGICSRWFSADGTELESFCLLTTNSNQLIKPLNQRMPCVIPNGFEEQWTKNFKNPYELNGLLPLLKGWSSKDWLVEKLNNSSTSQTCLF